MNRKITLLPLALSAALLLAGCGGQTVASSSSAASSTSSSSQASSSPSSSSEPVETADKISSVTALGDYTVKGVVVAVSTNSILLDDGTGRICYYNKGNCGDYEVGQYLKVSGTIDATNYRYGNFQFTSTATVAVLDKTKAPTIETTPTDYDATKFDTWFTSMKAETSSDNSWSTGKTCKGLLPANRPLVKIRVKAVVSGDYYNYSIEGSTNGGGFTLPSSITITNNQYYDITGYLYEVVSQKYAYLWATKAEVYTPDVVVSSAEDATGVQIGKTLQLTATLKDTTDSISSWASDPTTIATVDSTGLVTGVAEGSATITATTVAGKTGKFVVTVYASVPEPDYTVSTIADVIAATDDTDLSKAYVISGKVKAWSGTNTDGSKYGNFTLTDGTNDIVVYGATATASALAWNDADGVYKYTNAKDFLTNDYTKAIKVGDELNVIAVRQVVKGVIEVSIIIRSIGAVIVPNAALMTTDEVQAVSNDAFHTYLVKGKITAWKGTNTDGTAYGNLSIKSEGATGDALVVYGLTANENAMSITASSGKMYLTNPKDFLTNGATKSLAVGDEITILAYRADYSGSKQISGVLSLTDAVTSVTLSGDSTVLVDETIQLGLAIAPATAPQGVAWTSSDDTVATVSSSGVVKGVAAGEVTITATSIHDSTKIGTHSVTVTAPAPIVVTDGAVAAYNFRNNGSTSTLTGDTAKALFASSAISKTGLSDIVSKVTVSTNVYAGGSGYEQFGIKLGTSKASGVLTFTTSSSITKAVVYCVGWEETDTIAIGDATAQSPETSCKTSGVALKALTFTFTANTTITITTTNRMLIGQIDFIA
jgi:uncharacterized protein YjdB